VEPGPPVRQTAARGGGGDFGSIAYCSQLYVSHVTQLILFSSGRTDVGLRSAQTTCLCDVTHNVSVAPPEVAQMQIFRPGLITGQDGVQKALDFLPALFEFVVL
jgi:hypothetical protein